MSWKSFVAGQSSAWAVVVFFASSISSLPRGYQDTPSGYAAARAAFDEAHDDIVAVMTKWRANHATDVSTREWGAHFLGQSFEEARRLREAEGAFEQAVKTEPDEALHHIALARVATLRRDPASAARRYRKARERYSDPAGRDRLLRLANDAEDIGDDIAASRSKVMTLLGVVTVLIFFVAWRGRSSE